MTEKRPLAVIVMDGPLAEWQAPTFGVPYFLSAGIDVVVFDALPFLKTGRIDAQPAQGVFATSDPAVLFSRIDQASRTFFFSFYDLADRRFAPLVAGLKSRKIGWCLVRAGAIPAPVPPRSLKERVGFAWFQVRRLLRKLGPIVLVRTAVTRQLERLARKSASVFAPEYVMVDGLKSQAANPYAGAIIIPSHSRDCEMVMQQGIEAALDPDNICVFIDQNEPNHVDWQLQGVTKSDLPEEGWYVTALQRCFEEIERVTGLRVVVLPHPRYEYPDGYFGRFEVRRESTSRAVARAKLVVTHYSTAIAFAVIFGKPSLLLTAQVFKDQMGARTDRFIEAFATELGCPVFLMDDPRIGKDANLLRIDAGKYALYSADYIRHPKAQTGSMWEAALKIMGNDQRVRG